MVFDKILDYDESDSDLEPYFRLVQTQIIGHYTWYKRNSIPARLFFRTSGALVIIFSVTIPALAAIPIESFPAKDLVIAVMALGIAILSGLNTFYKWGEKWQSFVRAEMAIKHLIGFWKMDIHEAKLLENKTERLAAVNNATKKLIGEAGNIVSQETEDYFSKVQWPKRQGTD